MLMSKKERRYFLEVIEHKAPQKVIVPTNICLDLYMREGSIGAQREKV